MTKEEWMSEQPFPDVVAMSSPRTEGEPLIHIPFGCLVPKKLENLLAAGRCISVDPMVHSCARLIPPCLATGQAAGTAAALAVAQGVTPREIDRSKLQASLIQQEARLE